VKRAFSEAKQALVVAQLVGGYAQLWVFEAHVQPGGLHVVEMH